MGYLAAKDTGKINIFSENNLFTGSINSPDGTFNTSENNGITNLSAYQFSFDSGKVVKSDPNITGNTTRLSVGSKLPIPFKLTASFNRKSNNFNNTSEIISERDINTISYLFEWARDKNIIMLFYMPNTSTTSLNYKQEKDFYTSELKILYDVIWDKNLGTSAYGATTYGTIHYSTGATINSVAYQACAIPVIFEKITVNYVANSYLVEVSVDGFVLENEGR
jgi:hypothetical protein